MAGEVVAIHVDVGHGVPDEAQATTKIQKLDGSHITPIAQGKIHRFPRGLIGIGGSNEQRYIVPTFVAIGPYHHGKPHLHKMEEVKLAAMNRFIATANGASAGDVSGKLLSVVGDVRGCYADDEKLKCFSDDDFAAMMLVDGCFLLQFMMEKRKPLFEGRALSSEYSILKDMMLLENQVPWLVLDTLMEFLPMEMEVEQNVRRFVADVGDMFLRNNKEHEVSLTTSCFSVLFEVSPHKSSFLKDYKPANLLDLLRSSQIFRMPTEELSVRLVGSSLLSSSAVELAQIGVNLTASTAEWFGDMSVKEGPVYGELSLSPMFLNDVSAGWLVNMAALEASGGATTADQSSSSSSVMCSFLSVVAMLMDREEDVHQLRAKQVLYSTLSNAQTLDFFKRISQHLGFGHRYFYILQQINKFKQGRPVRSAVHKFLYKHIRAISIILSIASVLVGIFKALREL
ncbi:UPF0481 protein At3g47200-like [Oryza glaberrima]|uniref:Uncharacterized protein n=1 Tax=Oryza glaberrima TaxID=4538 RepID=I1QF83_ORYGL|nr:UPF0481 protein At3g47200-like [Oryza glaberrima]